MTSFRAVGTLLVFGLLIAPPATASLIARSVPAMMLTSAALAAASVVVGLLASWHFATAAGATVAGVAVITFFVVLLARDHIGGRAPVAGTSGAEPSHEG